MSSLAKWAIYPLYQNILISIVYIKGYIYVIYFNNLNF